MKFTTACRTDAGETPATKRKGERSVSLESRRLACDTLGVGNIDVRKKLPTPAQPTQARRLLSRLRCGGDYGGNYRRLRSLLCRAPKGDGQAPLRGRLWWKLPPPTQPTQARRLLSRLRSGGDFGGNYHFLHNRRRRDACVLCFAERLRRWPGCAAGATLTKVTDACFPGCAAGATTVEITTAYTTDAGETPAFQANAVFTLPLVRRRDACGLCFAERLWRWPCCAAGDDFGGWVIKNHLRGVAKVIFY